MLCVLRVVDVALLGWISVHLLPCCSIKVTVSDAKIHLFIFFPEQNYSESRYHFLHSSDGEGCAQMLVEYSASRGYRSEVDMFVAQAVLQ